jgi:hypothetical protein
MLEAQKKEMLKKARQIIPDMQLCVDPHCRFCTINEYPSLGNYYNENKFDRSNNINIFESSAVLCLREKTTMQDYYHHSFGSRNKTHS